jgi:hypothetical protein
VLDGARDASYGKRRSNVWASNAGFVELVGGDHEEHAHLLAGHFLELGQEVSLQGSGRLGMMANCCQVLEAGDSRHAACVDTGTGQSNHVRAAAAAADDAAGVLAW